MTDLSALGLVSFGVVLTLAVLGGFVLWVTRGHRVDLTSVRLVNVREESDRRQSFGPRRWIPKDDSPFLDLPEKIDAHRLKHQGVEQDAELFGDSERPPAVQQHGARTREVDGGG